VPLREMKIAEMLQLRPGIFTQLFSPALTKTLRCQMGPVPIFFLGTPRRGEACASPLPERTVCLPVAHFSMVATHFSMPASCDWLPGEFPMRGKAVPQVFALLFLCSSGSKEKID
jgi:hypothetical protein